jgi:hypothetical protein
MLCKSFLCLIVVKLQYFLEATKWSNVFKYALLINACASFCNSVWKSLTLYIFVCKISFK